MKILFKTVLLIFPFPVPIQLTVMWNFMVLYKLIVNWYFIFITFSTCFEPKGSSSWRWLCMQVWYNLFNAYSVGSLV